MDEATQRHIDQIVSRLLVDVGFREPPVLLEPLLRHLKVDIGYYNLEDPSFLQRIWHKVKVEGSLLIELVRHVKLAAVWLPDEDHIWVDSSLPPKKRDWASFHDASHRLLPWHRPYFLGDTQRTLDPEFQAQLEAEASFSASALMFGGVIFTQEARDAKKEWASIDVLGRRYKRSLVTTLWRFVQHGPDHAMVMMVSTPSWAEIPEDRAERWRYFIPSPRFRNRFSLVTPQALLDAVDQRARKQRAGLVADFPMILRDDRGVDREFRVETFFNSYDNLTLCVETERVAGNRRIVISAPVREV